MKKCSSCDFENSDDSQFCANCGAAFQGSDKPVDPFETVAPTVENNAPPKSTEKTETGFKGTVMSVKNKVMNFEGNHRLIVNLLVVICAIVIALVALFAPVKVTNVRGEETSDDVYEYVEVDQSIFQMIGALTYINAGPEKLQELVKDIYEADDESDVNWLAYLIATNETTSGMFYAAVISAAFGAIIALIAIIIAIYSLVYLIKSIIAMTKKQQQDKLFKYLGAMLTLSGSGLGIMFAAPMLAAGGGMFAVALFTAIAMLLCGVVGSLVAGRDGVLTVIKHSVVAFVAMIAFFILCSNVFCIKTESEFSSSSLNVGTGYGLFNVLATMDVVFGASEASEAMFGAFASSMVGIVFYILMAGFAIPYALKSMQRALKRLAYGSVAKSPKAYMIASAVFMLIAIIAGMGFSDTISEKFAEIFHASLVTKPAKWLMNAQVWASMILLILTVVAEFVFNPKKKEPAPAPEAQTEQAA